VCGAVVFGECESDGRALPVGDCEAVCAGVCDAVRDGERVADRTAVRLCVTVFAGQSHVSIATCQKVAVVVITISGVSTFVDPTFEPEQNE
jgi:lactate dehydrogenase-like 2-hydroxyacid dehydrogenase